MTWVGRFGRWLAVVVCAFALRHSIDEAEALTALTKAYGGHRDMAWRLGILEDAQARNRARMASR